jgi:hypothetical protein
MHFGKGMSECMREFRAFHRQICSLKWVRGGRARRGCRIGPARESVRGRSNLKTLHWSVFPRQAAGRFSPRPRDGAPPLVLGALSLNPSHRSSAGHRRKRALPGGGRARPGGACAP